MMTFEQVYDAVVQTLIHVSGSEHIAAEMPLSGCHTQGGLALDELDQVTLVMEVEKRLNIDIDLHAFETPLALAKHAFQLGPKLPRENVDTDIVQTFPTDYIPPAKE